MSASSHLLYSNYVEKTFIEDCANLYGLLKAMESLENAWIRDIVDADSYQRMCQRLISQKRELYDGEFKSKVGPLQKFAEEYNIHVRRAIRRYEKGVPATVEMPDRDNTGAGVIIQVTQDILEFKDMLYLKMTDIDQLIPVINKIVAGLRSVKQINAETPELQKLIAWLGKLQNRSINEGITEDENRELGFVAQSTLDRLKASVK